MSTQLKELMETPTASMNITENGTHNVTNVASAVVNVATNWGDIGGTLTNQTDLQGALNNKQDTITSDNKLSADLIDDSTATNKFVTVSDKATWNNKQNALTPGSNISITNNTISATDTTYSPGANIQINGTTISATDTTYTTATTSESGLMSTSDKTKLDSITTQTAYSGKGTASKVPQITTNSFGQVTAITEIDIAATPGEIIGTTYPTTSTVAQYVGQRYNNITALDGQFVCTAINGDTYTWKPAYHSLRFNIPMVRRGWSDPTYTTSTTIIKLFDRPINLINFKQVKFHISGYMGAARSNSSGAVTVIQNGVRYNHDGDLGTWNLASIMNTNANGTTGDNVSMRPFGYDSEYDKSSNTIVPNGQVGQQQTASGFKETVSVPYFNNMSQGTTGRFADYFGQDFQILGLFTKIEVDTTSGYQVTKVPFLDVEAIFEVENGL